MIKIKYPEIKTLKDLINVGNRFLNENYVCVVDNSTKELKLELEKVVL